MGKRQNFEKNDEDEKSENGKKVKVGEGVDVNDTAECDDGGPVVADERNEHEDDDDEEEDDDADDDDDDEESGEGDIPDEETAALVPELELTLDREPHQAAPDVLLPSHVFDLTFHPNKPILAAALLSGEAALCRFRDPQEDKTFMSLLSHHSKACRSVRFFPSGERILTASSDRLCIVANTEGQVVWKVKGHDDGVNAIKILDEHVFASGDDGGMIKLWDTRKKDSCVASLLEYEEYVSSMELAQGTKYLLATSGDKLGVYDLRKPKKTLWALSDNFNNDLTSIAIVRSGQKVAVGSESGNIWLFDWGDFGAARDNVPGHTGSVDCMTALENDTLLTGSADGYTRVVRLYPNKVAGTMGVVRENRESVEAIALSPDKDVLAVAHMDQLLRFMDTEAAYKASRRSAGDESRSKRATEPAAGLFFEEL